MYVVHCCQTLGEFLVRPHSIKYGFRQKGCAFSRAGREFLQTLCVKRASTPIFCRRVTRTRVPVQINFFCTKVSVPALPRSQFCFAFLICVPEPQKIGKYWRVYELTDILAGNWRRYLGGGGGEEEGGGRGECWRVLCMS